MRAQMDFHLFDLQIAMRQAVLDQLITKESNLDTVLAIGLIATRCGVSIVLLGLWSFRSAIRAGGCVAFVIGGILVIWGLGLVASVFG